MFNFVSTSLLADRLDAEFYSEDQIKNQQLLVNYGSVAFESLCHAINVGFTGELTSVYVNSGVPLYRVSDIDDIFLNESDVNYVPNEFAKENPQIAIRDGDLVLAAVGNTIGKAAIKGKNVTHGVCSRALMIARPKHDAVDGYFLIAHIATRFGQKSLLRGVSGSAQPVLNTPLIAGIPIPKIESLCQKYIGDKVRQAERLRAWAKGLRTSVDKVLDQLSLPTADEPAMINRVSTERLEVRLDPRPYRTHYIKLVDQIKAIKHSCVSDVADLASGCPVSSSDFIDSGVVPLVRIRNIGFDEFIDLDTGVTKELHKDEAKYQAKENMIVLGMDGIFRAQFFLSDELPMLVNQRVGMITTNDIRAELLTHWLNRPEGQMQLNQWAVKTTVEHTSISDIGRVRIPRLDTDIEEDLADKLLNARRAYRYSRFLTTSAKLLVEALIEGQLTETELIAAEQALQAGNDKLDRRILNRLKTDRVDGQGPALFGDLDELYHLLTQAAED